MDFRSLGEMEPVAIRAVNALASLDGTILAKGSEAARGSFEFHIHGKREFPLGRVDERSSG